MSKNKLFDDDSEEEVALKTENAYAKKYDAWREKEEIHKLEQKYGSKALDAGAPLSSDSEDESDEPPDVSEEMETQFLKTLALLKTKDPRIYDSSYKFFNEENKPKQKEITNAENSKTMTFADSDDDDDDDPNIFTIEKKAEVDKEEPNTKNNEHLGQTSKDGKLKDYLTGKAEHIENEVEKDLEPLKAFWSDPKLNEGEAFLRDYILNKRYLEEGDGADDKLRDDVELEADEELVEEQGKFERAYNFRFEEPDDEYLKRYPRTMNSVRPKDDRRARKRAETRSRKEEEKNKKMEEIARLKALKLKEVQEKIARIKQVTGNEQLAFKDEDIEGDFDPEEHDRRMKAIFDDEYYGEADEQKPVFPDLDEELEIENWENFEEDEFKQEGAIDDTTAPHCEDEDFNMDADYDPKRARENLLEELKRNMGKKRRNRKRKTKLGQLLATEKPKFVPDFDKTYSEFMEEYYKMDCEDVIGGDLPTRFKYREVLPNDYGLTVEEILLADDKELTQWVPLKKIVKHRPANVEKSEVNTYKQKAADVVLKKKMLPSLFKDLPEEPEIVVPIQDGKKKKRKKKKKDKEQSESSTTVEEIDQGTDNAVVEETLQASDNAIVEETEQDTDNAVELKADAIETSSNTKRKKKRKGNRKAFEENKNNTEEQIFNEMKNKELHKSQMDVSCREDDKEIIAKLNNETRIASKHSVNTHVDNIVKPVERKTKKLSNSFIVEDIGNVEPSLAADVTTVENKTVKQAKKRTINECGAQDVESNSIPMKKNKKHKNAAPTQNEHVNAKFNKNPIQNKNFDMKKNKNKDFKKIQSKNKYKQEKDKPIHPFSNLSDERLKAYGLNPKKYKNFLKYKKY